MRFLIKTLNAKWFMNAQIIQIFQMRLKYEATNDTKLGAVREPTL